MSLGRGWRAIGGVVGAALALTVGAGAATKPACLVPEPGNVPANVLVVLFDISQSTDSRTLRSAYQQDFDQKLAFSLADKNGALFGDGTYVVVGAIDENSAINFQPFQCTLPHKGGNDNPLVFAVKSKGMNDQFAAAAHSIIGGPRESKGTTILDALTATSNLVAPALGAAHKYLVIFSDMLEDSQRLKMTDAKIKPAAEETFIKQERAAGNLPKLRGFQVYVAGAGATATGATTPLKRDAIRRFWMTYFKAAGATLSPTNYNGRLLRFP